MAETQYDLAGIVIGLAMKVQSALVSGYLESVYKKALIVELNLANFKVEEEKRLTVRYLGVVVGEFIADIVVNDILIIELKAISALVKAHEVQLVNYLTVTGIDEGLLLNFGTERLEYRKKFRVYRPKS